MDEPGQDWSERITRRRAIGTGIVAAGVAATWPAAAGAATDRSRRLLAQLRAAVRDSGARPRARRQLLSLLGQVSDALGHGRADDCRQILQTQFIPVVRHSAGHHGITARDARNWTADAQRLARSLPRAGGAKSGVAGRMTVFNVYSEPVNGLAVAGDRVGSIAGVSDGRPNLPPRYTPASIVVPRSKARQPGAFAIGDNDVLIPWDSFLGSATVRVPDPRDGVVSVDDDLWLYLATNRVTLITTRGYVLDTFPVRLGLG